LEENHLHAKYFGIATHYCLEMMDKFTIESLIYSVNLAKTRYSNYLSEFDFEDIKTRISLMIKNDNFISLIDNSEFITEQSLIYKDEIKIIDLLFFKEDTYYIVDYKTTKDRLPEHIAQVSFYKKAIKDIFNTQNVKSYLVYLYSRENFIQEV
jgi:exodeoxyribonuclease V beta subunit